MPIRKILKSPAGKAGSAGFTLVELLVVLGVIALLITALPAIVGAARPGVQARAAADILADDLRTARLSAILNDSARRVLFANSHTSYAIEPDLRARSMATGVTLEFAPSSEGAQTAELRFFPDGSSSGGRVRITSGSQHRFVTAHALTGRVTVDE